MSNDPIRDNAISRRDAALGEAKRWDDFVRMLDELREGAPRNYPAPAIVRPDQNNALRVIVGTGQITETERLATEIIREAGRPIPTREMLEALAARGMDVGGKEPSSTLSARLSRSTTLENVRPYGWRLKEPRQTNEAAGSTLPEHPATSSSATPNDAVMRGEVAHDNMT